MDQTNLSSLSNVSRGPPSDYSISGGSKPLGSLQESTSNYMGVAAKLICIPPTEGRENEHVIKVAVRVNDSVKERNFNASEVPTAQRGLSKDEAAIAYSDAIKSVELAKAEVEVAQQAVVKTREKGNEAVKAVMKEHGFGQEFMFVTKNEATKLKQAQTKLGETQVKLNEAQAKVPSPPPPPARPLAQRASSHCQIPFSRAISQAAGERCWKGVESGMISAGHRAEDPVALRSLGVSVNPVGKVNPTFYVSAEAVAKESEQVEVTPKTLPKNFQAALENVCKNIPASSNAALQKQEAIAVIQKLFKENVTLKFPANHCLNSGEVGKLTKVVETFRDQQIEGSIARQTASAVLDQLKGLSPQPPKLPAHYRKDEILSDLRVLLQSSPDVREAEEGRSQLILVMREIGAKPEAFLSKESLAPHLEKIAQAMTDFGRARLGTEVSAINQEAVLKRLTPYISSADAMVPGRVGAAQMQAMVRAGGAEVNSLPAFAFKTGGENAREMLGQKVLRSLNLDTYILPKWESKAMTGVRLAHVDAPQGIVSEWVGGEEFPKKVWKEWLNVKQEHAKATAEGSVSSSLQKKFDEMSARVMAQGGAGSIATHILTDTVLGAGDSHINQYKMDENGNLVNFDWARFLNPHPTYRKGDQTFLALRMALLDHPIADQPLSSQPELAALRDKVLSWDADAIVEQWNRAKMTGSEEFFAQSATRLKALEDDFVASNKPAMNREGLLQIAEKHHVVVDEKWSDTELKQNLQTSIRLQYQSIREDAYGKIDPKATEQFSHRLKGMQDYFRANPNGTLRGGWEAYNPEVAPFIKVLERLEVNPGDAMQLRRLTAEALETEKKAVVQEALERAKANPQQRDKNKLSTELRAKLDRAAQVAVRKNQGVSEGAKPMAEQYMGELVDTKHRYGGQIHAFWQVWQNTPAITDSFNEWLTKIETGADVPGKDLLEAKKLIGPDAPVMGHVQYLDTPQARASYRLDWDIDGDFATEKSGKLNTTNYKEQPHIFVLGQDKQIYVGQYEKGALNHSSFFGGRPVLGAGRMLFENGILKEISDYSGHYQPDNTMTLRTLEHFQQIMGDTGLARIKVNFTRAAKTMDGSTALKQLRAEADKSKAAPVAGHRPLESILRTAKATPGIASESEIAAMENQIKKLNQESPSYIRMRPSYSGIG